MTASSTDSFEVTEGASRQDQSATEQWKPIPGSEGLYSVSDLGRIRSEPIQLCSKGRQRGRVLACHCDSKGYLQFRMSLRDRRISMKVHRAVALAFIGPRPPGAQINHISGDKRDNSVRNLEYVSCRENVQHSWKTGLCGVEHRRGEHSVIAKLTPDAVREIRRSKAGASLAELGRRFGVSKQCIRLVLIGKTWRHVA